MNKTVPDPKLMSAHRSNTIQGDWWELHDDRDQTIALRIRAAAAVPFKDHGQVLAYLYCALESYAGRFVHRELE